MFCRDALSAEYTNRFHTLTSSNFPAGLRIGQQYVATSLRGHVTLPCSGHARLAQLALHERTHDGGKHGLQHVPCAASGTSEHFVQWGPRRHVEHSGAPVLHLHASLGRPQPGAQLNAAPIIPEEPAACSRPTLWLHLHGYAPLATGYW